jgi:uncharacterized protein (TIGR02466 family)
MAKPLKNSFFSTQIYTSKLAKPMTTNLIKELGSECYKIKAADREGTAWSKQNYINGYTSYSSTSAGFDRLHLISPHFKTLELALNKQVSQFIKQLDYDIAAKDLKMTQCWVNIMGQNSTHTSHAHPLSVLSGTFYVDVPQKSSTLKFEDPRLPLFMNTPAVKDLASIHNQRFIEIMPVTGYVIMFESWLKHEVPINLGKKDRISISFNYGWA